MPIHSYISKFVFHVSVSSVYTYCIYICNLVRNRFWRSQVPWCFVGELCIRHGRVAATGLGLHGVAVLLRREGLGAEVVGESYAGFFNLWQRRRLRTSQNDFEFFLIVRCLRETQAHERNTKRTAWRTTDRFGRQQSFFGHLGPSAVGPLALGHTHSAAIRVAPRVQIQIEGGEPCHPPYCA